MTSNDMEVTDIRSPWWEMGEALTLQDVMGDQRIISVKSEDNLSSLFQTLRANNVLGVGVVEGQSLRGFVDVYDILSFLIISATQGKEEVTLDEIKTFLNNYKDVAKAFRVGNLVNLSGNDQLKVLPESAKIVDAMRIFANEIHRIAVSDSTGAAVGILSQSDIIHHFAHRGASLGRLVDQPIENLDIGTGDILKVNETSLLFEALQQMRLNRVSAAAVVDHRGFLTSNLSVSDLKTVDPESLASLTIPVKEFLYMTYGFPKPPICVRGWETVEHVMLKIMVHQVHRVWVVNNAFVPIGVVTLTDLIRFFLAN